MQVRIKGCNYCKLNEAECKYRKWLIEKLKKIGDGKIIVSHNCKEFVSKFEKGDKVVVWTFYYEDDWIESEHIEGVVIGKNGRKGYFIQVAEDADLSEFNKDRIYDSYYEYSSNVDIFDIDSINTGKKGAVIFSRYNYMELR